MKVHCTQYKFIGDHSLKIVELLIKNRFPLDTVNKEKVTPVDYLFLSSTHEEAIYSVLELFIRLNVSEVFEQTRLGPKTSHGPLPDICVKLLRTGKMSERMMTLLNPIMTAWLSHATLS